MYHFSDGDERDFMEHLYTEHSRIMYRQADKIMRDHAAAEDVVNEACMLLIRKTPELRQKSDFRLRGYVVSTVRNAAINAYNRRKREQDRCDSTSGEWIDEMPDKQTPVDANLLQQEQIDAMARALMALPERAREMLRMKYFEELSNAEIASSFGVKEASVRSLLSRARHHIKALMRDEGYD